MAPKQNNYLPKARKLVAAFFSFCVSFVQMVNKKFLTLKLFIAAIPQTDVGSGVWRINLLLEGSIWSLRTGVGGENGFWV